MLMKIFRFLIFFIFCTQILFINLSAAEKKSNGYKVLFVKEDIEVSLSGKDQENRVLRVENKEHKRAYSLESSDDYYPVDMTGNKLSIATDGFKDILEIDIETLSAKKSEINLDKVRSNIKKFYNIGDSCLEVSNFFMRDGEVWFSYDVDYFTEDSNVNTGGIGSSTGFFLDCKNNYSIVDIDYTNEYIYYLEKNKVEKDINIIRVDKNGSKEKFDMDYEISKNVIQLSLDMAGQVYLTKFKDDSLKTKSLTTGYLGAGQYYESKELITREGKINNKKSIDNNLFVYSSKEVYLLEGGSKKRILSIDGIKNIIPLLNKEFYYILDDGGSLSYDTLEDEMLTTVISSDISEMNGVKGIDLMEASIIIFKFIVAIVLAIVLKLIFTPKDLEE